MSSNTPKTMSNRLMTMKFMQRSAAKNVASPPSTPNGPPSKKKRLSDGRSMPSAPGTPDQEILATALAEEEKKRQEALDRAAQHTTETKWVLSYIDPLEGKRDLGLQVRQAGYAELDAEDSSDEEEEPRPLRRQYGGGVKRPEKPTFKQVDNEDDNDDQDGDSEDESSDEYNSDDPTAELIRETKREMSKKRDESQKRNDGAGRAAVARSGLSRSMPNNQACYSCGKKGHISRDCPNRSTPGRGRGERR